MTIIQTHLTTFTVRKRIKPDTLGNPIYIFEPNERVTLPKLRCCRLNQSRRHYSLQSHNIEESINIFTKELETLNIKQSKPQYNRHGILQN